MLRGRWRQRSGHAFRLLKTPGVLLLTVPYSLEATTAERFPELHEFGIARVGDTTVLVNRSRSGELRVFENLVFHRELRRSGARDAGIFGERFAADARGGGIQRGADLQRGVRAVRDRAFGSVLVSDGGAEGRSLR